MSNAARFIPALRSTLVGLAAGAMSLGLMTANAGSATAAPVAETCTGTASIYGTLADGRLTYSAIDPLTGNRLKTLIGPELGFTPKAMATLNFNTVLVTSTAGALYRVDVLTNNNSLVLSGVEKIADSGWTHDKLTYDGYGHLYGTAGGVLMQYLVSQPKPQGSQHIGQRVEIDKGFVLKTLTAVGDDRLLATTQAGALYSYKIIGRAWKRDTLKAEGWSNFDQLLSPGGGYYYGRSSAGGLYWYKDADISDGSGSDITYHTDDPVDAKGWTQTLLSAAPSTVTCKVVNQLGQTIARAAENEVGNNFSDFDFDHNGAWCAEFGQYIWSGAGVDHTNRLDARAISFREYGLAYGTYRTSAPKVGDAVLYDADRSLTDGDADHINLVVEVSADGKQIRTVGGNESRQVQKSAWFTWSTATSPIGAGPVLAFISPIG
ncbi:CHAP domain-containing protein [Streptomyces sp. NPDC051569]|uniref:CHAP domain-containing protein n=1 Tax=Streptomyces sp. NPDC051569 TaxID=3365661 RepID=UPI0037912D11